MKKWSLLSFFLFVTIISVAQLLPVNYDHYTRFSHLTVDDGLPGNNVTVIRQDASGFMWIGTREGLARFDGTRFRIFRHIPGDSASLANDYINDILITPSQTVFVATWEGISIFQPETFTFRQVPELFKNGRGLLNAHVRALQFEDEKHIWAETYDGTLHKLNIETWQTGTFQHDKPSQPYYDYHALYKDRENTLWIGGRNMGPLKKQGKNIIRIENDPGNPRKKRDADVAFFFEDSNNDFWVGGLDGLYQYDRKNDVFNKRMSTSSYKMTECRHGCLWVATGKGLAKIDRDRKEITKFLPTDNDNSSIIHDNLNCITLDMAGNLWIGTERGISILNTTQNMIRHYRHLHKEPHSLSNNHVSSFLEDKAQNIWVGTRGGGLNLFHKENDRFEHFKFSDKEENSISSDQVSALFEDNDGKIWIGLWQGVGFNRFDPDTKHFEHFALDSSSFKSDWYCDFAALPGDTLMAGFWGAEGIRLFDKKHQKWLSHCFRPSKHPVTNEIKRIDATDPLLWVYLRGNILHTFNPETETFKAYRSKLHEGLNRRHQIKSVELPDFSQIFDITSKHRMSFILTDKGVIKYSYPADRFELILKNTFYLACPASGSQNIYLTGDNGLSCYNTVTQSLQNILNRSDIPVAPEQINDINFLPENSILFATNKGIFIYNLTEKKFKSGHLLPAMNNLEQPVQKIINGRDNSWLLVLDKGIAFPDSSHKLTHYNTDNSFHSGFRSNTVNDALKSKYGNRFWLATLHGLYLFSPDENTFEEIAPLRNVTINDIGYYEDNLFLATARGLAVIKEDPFRLKFYNHPPDDALSSHLLTFLSKDLNGNVWAGTSNNGLNKINPRTLKTEHFLPGKGIYGNEISAFAETSDGFVFAGGDSLNMLIPGEKNFRMPEFAKHLPHGKIVSLLEVRPDLLLIAQEHHLFTVRLSDGTLFDLTPLLSTQNITFTGAVLKTSDNEILIGSLKGFFRFQEAIIDLPSKPKNTKITRVDVMGTPYETTRFFNSKPTLKHNENFIEFFFSDMEYPDEHDRYLYKLEGIDPDWTTTESSSIAYKTLPPGDYTFKVKAVNKLGETSQARFPFTIRPPFWQAWWFIISVLATLVISFVSWWRYRLYHLQIIESNLNLRQRLLLSQMNPHFLFNALSAIQAFILKNHPLEAGAYLSKFAKLMRLNLNNMAMPVTPVNTEVESIRYYLELQRLRFNNEFNYTVTLIPDITHHGKGLPTMMVQPFVENAVEHGLAGLNYAGNLTVSFTLQNNSWLINIRDNGLGINESCRRKNEAGSSHKSMSMEIIRNRIEQLSRQYKQPFSLTIRDLTDETAAASGTEIRLVVPAINID